RNRLRLHRPTVRWEPNLLGTEFLMGILAWSVDQRRDRGYSQRLSAKGSFQLRVSNSSGAEGVASRAEAGTMGHGTVPQFSERSLDCDSNRVVRGRLRGGRRAHHGQG